MEDNVLPPSLCVFLVVGLVPSGRTIPADEKKSGAESVPEVLRGRWTTTREWKEDGKTRRQQLTLEFGGGRLGISTEEAGSSSGFSLQFIGVEPGEGASRLILGREGKRGCAVYYDFVKEKLILVGGCPPNRPFEGFPLSGEYTRVEKPKAP